MNNKVFLGGTCSKTFKEDYRSWLIPILENNKIPYFNPYVSNWNDESIKIEENEKENCALELYVLLSAQMRGVYSIYEMTKCAIEKKGRCLIILDTTGNKNKDRMRSLHKTVEQLEKIGAQISYQNFDCCNDDGSNYLTITDSEYQDYTYLNYIRHALECIKRGKDVFTGKKIKLNDPLHKYFTNSPILLYSYLNSVYKEDSIAYTEIVKLKEYLFSPPTIKFYEK